LALSWDDILLQSNFSKRIHRCGNIHVLRTTSRTGLATDTIPECVAFERLFDITCLNKPHDASRRVIHKRSGRTTGRTFAALITAVVIVSGSVFYPMLERISQSRFVCWHELNIALRGAGLESTETYHCKEKKIKVQSSCFVYFKQGKISGKFLISDSTLRKSSLSAPPKLYPEI